MKNLRPEACRQDLRFFPLVARAYFFGTLLSALALHFAVALIAPGDAGTALALVSANMLFVFIILIGIIGLIVLPIGAAASWPFRAKVISNPLLTGLLSGGTGLFIGAALTATEFQIGPGDFWSGPLVGFVFGLVWFQVVRSSSKRNLS